MCFDFDARPPELPADLELPLLAGAAAAEQITLESADGSRFAAALAPTDQVGRPGLIILPDVRGLFRFYVELAERFSEAGYHAIAIDYFGRTAEVEERDEHFDFMSHLPDVKIERVHDDIAAARDALAERTGTTRFVTLGFCFGGSQSFIAASDPELALDAAIGFYGTLDGTRLPFPFEMPSPLLHVEQTRCPVLGLFGGDDDFIPQEDIDTFDRALEAAGVHHEVTVYAGAPHSFFDRSAEEHADASADAWRRVLSFLDHISASTTASGVR